MTPRQRSYPNPLARWLLGLMVLACVFALPPGEGAAAAASTQRTDAQHRAAGISSAATNSKDFASLRASLRDLQRAADRTVSRPQDLGPRFSFSVHVIGVSAQIVLAKASDESTRQQIKLAKRILEHERKRVYAAWRLADAGPEVAAIVRLLDGLTVDAAKASGARSSAELNAFKKNHLEEIKYAGRRWLVDGKVGRQGAVIISRGVRNPKLRNAIEQLYRPNARIGDGGTADALLAEVKAGCRGVACRHFTKAGEYRENLFTILSEERLTVTERGVAGELIGALTRSIRIAGGK